MEPSSTDGQAAPDSNGATEATPGGTDGQSIASGQTTSQGPVPKAEESFFDPKDIIGTDLEPAYKQMQSTWTKAMQSAKGNQHMVDAYKAFEANPQGTLQQLAQQYGYQLVQPGQEAAGEANGFEPQTWDEVMEKATEIATQKLNKDLQPLLNEVKGMKQSNMEAYMDNNHPDWRTYEGQMLQVLKDHPTMSSSPDLLYDMAIPAEVKQARAHKSAMAKIQGQTNASELSGSSTTTKTQKQAPEGIKSLDDAVRFARNQLATRGLKAPRDG